MMGKEDLRRNDTNHTAPTKPNTAAVEEGHIETICTSLDLSQDLSIVF